jgi:phage shock protein PspC (stress-responsive transcriptional regulator)
MKFRRSRNSYIGGVCGGLEKYVGLPAIIWRIIFVFILPYAFWIYILLWLFTDSE